VLKEATTDIGDAAFTFLLTESFEALLEFRSDLKTNAGFTGFLI